MRDPGGTLGLNRGHHQTATFGIADEALLLEELQRMADRLARHAERRRQLFPGDAGARRQTAAADRLEQALVHLLHQLGTGR